jgi:hypothetical protein
MKKVPHTKNPLSLFRTSNKCKSKHPTKGEFFTSTQKCIHFATFLAIKQFTFLFSLSRRKLCIYSCVSFPIENSISFSILPYTKVTLQVYFIDVQPGKCCFYVKVVFFMHAGVIMQIGIFKKFNCSDKAISISPFNNLTGLILETHIFDPEMRLWSSPDSKENIFLYVQLWSLWDMGHGSQKFYLDER